MGGPCGKPHQAIRKALIIALCIPAWWEVSPNHRPEEESRGPHGLQDFSIRKADIQANHCDLEAALLPPGEVCNRSAGTSGPSLRLVVRPDQFGFPDLPLRSELASRYARNCIVRQGYARPAFSLLPVPHVAEGKVQVVKPVLPTGGRRAASKSQ